MNIKPRSKVSLENKKLARKMFEAGVDMFDIHQELKINLGTLYNLSSKEEWEKGKRKELIHIVETEDELIGLKTVQKEIIKDYKGISAENRAILKELQLERHMAGKGKNKKEVRSLIKYKAESHSFYTKAASENYRLDKELYNIQTPQEKIDLMTKKIKYEALKKALDSSNDESDVTY